MFTIYIEDVDGYIEIVRAATDDAARLIADTYVTQDWVAEVTVVPTSAIMTNRRFRRVEVS